VASRTREGAIRQIEQEEKAPSLSLRDEEGARFSQKFESFLSRIPKDFSKGA